MEPLGNQWRVRSDNRLVNISTDGSFLVQENLHRPGAGPCRIPDHPEIA